VKDVPARRKRWFWFTRSSERAVRYLLITAALGAAFYSSILARAAYLFRLDTPNSVPAAVRLVPYNAAYVARLASWEPEERRILLRRAVELNPFDYESLLQLGLLAEMQDGDPANAERYYLCAAQVDRMFLPRWTLTNFYFRRQNQGEFFRWAKETLQITPYASDPIFSQMWLMNQDADRLDATVPARPQILLQYASFLANSGKFESVPRSVQRLVWAAGKADPRAWGRDDLIAAMTDRMLAQGDTNNALKVWRILNQAAWIRHSVPDAHHPLTNGDFRLPFFRHAFDWMPLSNAGIRIDRKENGGVRITFSGDQPEHCVLLQQYLPLQVDAGYLLKWQAKSSETVPGLVWHLQGRASEDLFASPAAWPIQAANAAQPFLLSLEYTRPAGQVRSAGEVTLDWVAMVGR
jgi:tetratricopeptide (TPR) repeat protein